MRGKEPGQPRQSMGLGWRGARRSRAVIVWTLRHHSLWPSSADGAGGAHQAAALGMHEKGFCKPSPGGAGLPGLLSHLRAGLVQWAATEHLDGRSCALAQIVGFGSCRAIGGGGGGAPALEEQGSWLDPACTGRGNLLHLPNLGPVFRCSSSCSACSSRPLCPRGRHADRKDSHSALRGFADQALADLRGTQVALSQPRPPH